MPDVGRTGDVCSGHGCWASRPSTGGSATVSINGIAALRVGDAYASHTCPAIPETHGGDQSGGSASVTVNGFALARVGDAVSCGSTLAQGSANVTCGG